MWQKNSYFHLAATAVVVLGFIAVTVDEVVVITVAVDLILLLLLLFFDGVA